jgi:N,N'-diacetyllegionaminate synthase
MNIEIIAEIAQGYEGNSKLAELLVKGAIAANADSVKLQLVYADELCVPEYEYFELFRSLEMKEEIWEGLVQMVKAANKKIYFDVYGEKSVRLAYKLKADGVKISTTDFYNDSLLKLASELFDTIFISIGGVAAEEIDLLINGKIKLPVNTILMHGFQAEPTATEDNNLRRIESLKNRYPQCRIGFMDHSSGINEYAFYLPMIAIGTGASFIEKHITLDYTLEIEDYISALSVDRFKQFVSIVKHIEQSLGSQELELNSKEIEYKKRAGKVVVAKNNILAGSVLTEKDLCLKRVTTKPTGTHFSKYSDVIGRNLIESININSPVSINNLG